MVEVGVAGLRRELKAWLERAADGEHVVVTDRGRPIARITSVAEADLLARLEDDGLVAPPGSTRVTRTSDDLAAGEGSAVTDELLGARGAAR